MAAALDPTIVAIPFYFGSMEVERRWLNARAEVEGPTPADYEKRDTIASLSMGVASLVVPLASHVLAQKVVPGKGKYGKALVRTVLAAAAATTVADRVQRSSRASRRAKRVAEQVSRIGGPVAVGGGVLAAATWSSKTNPWRMWETGQRRDLGGGPLAWVAAIAGWDFIYYWNHRCMHEVRGMWAIHVVHHSSERYNLSTALRQPVADVLGVWVPYGFLCRLGIRPGLVQQARGLNLIYQYWIHTDAIRSIGKGEEVLNTPSHHRVHHGSNARYIDRNHGSILIVWDRLFGTFQREEEAVVYGLTKNIESFAPPVIATHEYRDIVRDVAHADNWKDRLSFVLRGPGWAYERHRANAALRAG
jgi:sterol desaturase/sphingolipid hydroxylase (fatty acid hydroxylase superfamily)